MALFELDPLLHAMVDTAPGISDLNLSVGRPPQVEIDGVLRPVAYAGVERLMPYHTELIALRLLRGKRDLTEKLLRTGSAALAMVDGQRHQAGGWGFQIGDQMSGAILGRELVRYSVEAADGLVEERCLPAAKLETVVSVLVRPAGRLRDAVERGEQVDMDESHAVLLLCRPSSPRRRDHFEAGTPFPC